MIATALDRLEAPPSSKLLGWHLLDARPADGWVRIGFDGKPQFCNPAGFIQGGILGAMLDDTMGPAVFVMTDGRLYTATITMTVNFLAPARPGPLVGEAHVTQFGKSIAFVEGRLMGEDGTVLATATTSARLVDAAKAIPGPAGAGNRKRDRQTVLARASGGECGSLGLHPLPRQSGKRRVTPRSKPCPQPACSRSAAWR